MRQMDMMNIMDRWMNMIDKYGGYDKCTDELIDMMDRQIDIYDKYESQSLKIDIIDRYDRQLL